MHKDNLFIDTNIFIYSIFDVDVKKHDACLSLFEKAVRGEVNLWTTEWVVAELIWFLHRKKWTWDKIDSIVVDGVLATRGLTVRNSKWLMEILKPCKKVTDFFDSVNMDLLLSNGIKKGYSYDKGLDRYKGFKRLEPK